MEYIMNPLGLQEIQLAGSFPKKIVMTKGP